MSNTFNLNITDYDINELKDLLNLRDPYSLKDIVKNEDILREKLLLDTAVSNQKKKEIIAFLESVKDILIKHAQEDFKNIMPEEIINKEHSIISRRSNTVNRLNVVPRNEENDSGVSNKTINKLLCLDSRFRDNYYTTLSTNYSLTLPTVVKNVISMELSAFELPSTYFQISKSTGNHYFWIHYKCKSSTQQSSWFYIPIPDGNYLRKDMENIINKQIIIALESVSDCSQSYIPNVKIDENSTKTVFSLINNINNLSISDPSNIIFSVHFNKEDTPNNSVPHGQQDAPSINLNGYNGIVGNFGWILGYRMGTYEKSQAYISEGCYDAWGTKYFYIIVNDFNKNVNNFCIPSYNESMGKTNVLARISTKGASNTNFSDGLSFTNETVNNDNTSKKRYYFGPVNISRLELQIVDELGRVIDLNGMDYSMALNLICLYD